MNVRTPFPSPLSGAAPSQRHALGLTARFSRARPRWLAMVLGWLVLTSSALAQPASAPSLSSLEQFVVRQFQFEGNTAVAEEDLQKTVAGYLGRPIDIAQLEDARRALTEVYVDRGYINSGAVLEDQPVRDAVIRFKIVEGRLAEIAIEGNRWLREDYLRHRLARAAGTPLNVDRLREQLALLKENPNIRQINADLKPGRERGEGMLDVHVEDRSPFRAGVRARNDRPPSVGAEVIELLASDENLTGHSDALSVRYGVAHRRQGGMKLSGADNLGASYTLPLTASETTLELGYTRGDYAIIEEPFDSLNIDSQSDAYSVSLRQPLHRSPRREFAVSIGADRRRSESSLLGQPFSFSAGAVDGEMTVSSLRFVQEWVDRSQRRVLAFRSAFSLGLDILDATDDGSDRDGRYVKWLGQVQYVRRLGTSGAQMLLTAGFQWADGPLLPLEQFSVGGLHSVRGYRENQLVRDLAATGSIEVRIPVARNRKGVPWLQLAPFFDVGSGWNRGGATPDPRTLTSAGAGLLLDPSPQLQARLYWGWAFRDLSPAGSREAQDLGLHFMLQWMPL